MSYYSHNNKNITVQTKLKEQAKKSYINSPILTIVYIDFDRETNSYQSWCLCAH